MSFRIVHRLTVRCFTFVLPLLVSSWCFADSPCQYDEAFWEESIQYTNPFTELPERGTISLPLFGHSDCGDAVRYKIYNQVTMQPCECTADLKKNCNGECYEYVVVDIPNTFSGTIAVMGIVNGNQVTVVVPINKDNVNGSYDWKYAGYTSEGDVDFSINCHDYAFGCGDWPYTEEAVATPLKCYTACSPSEAVLATNVQHAIFISGSGCYVLETPMDAVISSSEKFRGSKTYKLAGSCSAPLDLTKTHKGANFTPYKEK